MNWLRKHPYLLGTFIFVLTLLAGLYLSGYRFKVLFPYDDKCGEQHIAFIWGQKTNDIKLGDLVLSKVNNEALAYRDYIGLGTITALPLDSLVYNQEDVGSPNRIKFSNVTRKGKFPSWLTRFEGKTGAFTLPQNSYWLWGYTQLHVTEFSRVGYQGYINAKIHQDDIIVKVNYIADINLWPYYKRIYPYL